MKKKTAKPARKATKTSPQARAQKIYEQVKRDIFDFRLLPGERFSESDIARRTGVSRTPLREATSR